MIDASGTCRLRAGSLTTQHLLGFGFRSSVRGGSNSGNAWTSGTATREVPAGEVLRGLMMVRNEYRISMRRITWLVGIVGTSVVAGCVSSSSLKHDEDSGVWTSVSSAGVAASAESDAVPPTVAISGPEHDSRLKGTVTLEAQTLDDAGVTQVRWFIDGDEIGVDNDGPPWSAPWNTTDVADGPHVVVTKAVDVGGNWGTSPAVGMWVDNDQLTNLVDTAVTRGPRATNTQTPTFEFTSQLPKAVFKCQLDGLDAMPCSSPLTLPNLHDGSHTLVVTAIAPSGDTDPSPAEVAFTVDTTPPTVEVIGPAQAETISGTIPLVAQARDSSGVTALRWYVNGVDVAYDADGEPWTRPWDSATVTDGRYRIFAKARDTAGNWGTSMSLDVTVSNGTAHPAIAVGQA